MLVRFRSKSGMHRISCEAGDIFGSLVEKLLPLLGEDVDPSSITVGKHPGQTTELAGSLADRTVSDLQLQHGDIVYVTYDTTAPTEKAESQSSVIQELPVDIELSKEDGLIPRQRSSLCKHGDKGMCEYCSPLPPWDRNYYKEHDLKHITFHSYVKQLNEATNKRENGSSYIAPLSQPNFKIDKHCRNGHEPWPKGICSKCQPSAITLKQQDFRMVDHVEFQKSDLINEFIESWRTTGTQRFGYLYGSYKKYDATPLGVKAVVEAIYEPPQHDEQDGLTMDMSQVEKEMQQVSQLAATMGLQVVGLIFTDLTDAGSANGSVLCKRHKDSFFLSSLEVMMAAKHQLHHPNVCRYSEQGFFSSKFVTCVISGNLQNEIDIASYQVSTDAEALVDANMIAGSTHPSMVYINETTDERYVPEIFYMKINEYGLTVKENAKPAFPVEYLLVSLTHGFPDNTAIQAKFQTSSGFPWANRQAMGLSQDYHELKKYLYEAATSGDFNVLARRLSNFHLLLYVHTLQILSQDEWTLLVKSATTTTTTQEPLMQLVSTPGWQTLIMVLQESF